MCINKQQVMVIDGVKRAIDDCLVPIITALNDGGCKTIASCCGHGNRWGNIILADGRELIIAPDYESSRAFDKVHGRCISDERRELHKTVYQCMVGDCGANPRCKIDCSGVHPKALPEICPIAESEQTDVPWVMISQ